MSKSDYSAIPMFEDFKKRLDKLKKNAEDDPIINFKSDQDMEEWVIISMIGTKFYNPFNTDEENTEFIRNIYRIGRTVGYMTRLEIDK